MQYKNVCVRGQYFSVCFQALSVMLRDCARAVTAVNFQKVMQVLVWLLPFKPVEENNTKQIHIVNIFCPPTVVANCGNPFQISCASVQTDDIQAFPPSSWGKPHCTQLTRFIKIWEEVLCPDMSSGMTGMSIH